ncbi:type VI secretion system contractile sheath large subunit [Bacterioplanoides sp.]|uniref:type VI secretion system contractile sheath large subunit n=1 Tax=Bacterioplanoides sp. TaxID=2066072 RepID=UPI003B00BD54
MEAITDRINLTFSDHNQIERELPMRILVIADLTADDRSEVVDIDDHRLLKADVGELMRNWNVCFKANIPNHLQPRFDVLLEIDYQLVSIDQFVPDQLIRDIPLLNRASQLYRLLTEENVKRKEIQPLLEEFQYSDSEFDTQADRLLIQADLEQRIQQQLNEVLNHTIFSQLEQSWRTIDFLRRNTPGDENIEVILWNSSKKALTEDFEDSPDITQSSLYEKVYQREFGQLGGKPYTLIVTDFDIGENSQDVALIKNMAAVAAMSHCPVISNASASLLGVSSFSELPTIRDLDAHFGQPAYARWQSFRSSSDSRYVALALPRFLLRSRYENYDSGVRFSESGPGSVSGVWGPSSVALASVFIRSFAKYRWFVNVTGDEYGLVDEISIKESNSRIRNIIPTEVMISDKTLHQLTRHGFTALSIYKRCRTAGFSAVPACLNYSDDETSGADDVMNQHLDGQLPFIMISCRFSHYLKIMQRENIGTWQTRSQIEQSLNSWLRQFVSDMDSPSPGVRAKRPLRSASVKVREAEGRGGWYLIRIILTPHFKYMGKTFTLKEKGRLEKA